MNEQHSSPERGAEGGPLAEHRPAGHAPDAALAAEAQEAEPRAAPRLYVASLTDYNNGMLHGSWIDADPDPDVMQEGIDQMLAASPTAAKYGDRAEEWAIHDYEGFGPLRLSEYEALSTVAHLASGIAAHGPAFAAWADHVGLRDAEQLAEFEDRYQGEWESAEAFAEDMLDHGGAQQIVEQAPVWLQPYLSLDAASFAHDLQLGGDIITVDRPDGGVWVWNGL